MDDDSADFAAEKIRAEITIKVCEDGNLNIAIAGICGSNDLTNIVIALIEMTRKAQQTEGSADQDCLKQVNDCFSVEKSREVMRETLKELWKMPDRPCLRDRQFSDEECDACPETKTCIFKGYHKRLRNIDDDPAFRDGNRIMNMMRIMEEELSKTPEGRKFLEILNTKFESRTINRFNSGFGSDNPQRSICIAIVICTAWGGTFAIVINRGPW